MNRTIFLLCWCFWLTTLSSALYKVEVDQAQFHHFRGIYCPSSSIATSTDDTTIPSYNSSNTSISLFKLTITNRSVVTIVTEPDHYIVVGSQGVPTLTDYLHRNKGFIRYCAPYGINYVRIIAYENEILSYVVTIQPYKSSYTSYSYGTIIAGRTLIPSVLKEAILSCQVEANGPLQIEYTHNSLRHPSSEIAWANNLTSNNLFITVTNPSLTTNVSYILTWYNSTFLFDYPSGTWFLEGRFPISRFPYSKRYSVVANDSFVGNIYYTQLDYNETEREGILLGRASLHYMRKKFGIDDSALIWRDPFADCWSKIYEEDGRGLLCRTDNDCFSRQCLGSRCLANDTHLLTCLGIVESQLNLSKLDLCLGNNSIDYNRHYYYPSLLPLTHPTRTSYSRWLFLEHWYDAYLIEPSTNLTTCDMQLGDGVPRCFFQDRIFPLVQNNCTTVCEDPITGDLLLGLTKEQCLTFSGDRDYCRGLERPTGCYLCREAVTCRQYQGSCNGIMLNNSNLFDQVACRVPPLICERNGTWTQSPCVGDATLIAPTRWTAGNISRRFFYQPVWGPFTYRPRYLEQRYDYLTLAEIANRRIYDALKANYYGKGGWQATYYGPTTIKIAYRQLTIPPLMFVHHHVIDQYTVSLSSSLEGSVMIDGEVEVLPLTLDLTPQSITITNINVSLTTYSIILNDQIDIRAELYVKGELVINGSNISMMGGSITTEGDFKMSDRSVMIVGGGSAVSIKGCAYFAGKLVVNNDDINLSYNKLCSRFESVVFVQPEEVCQARSLEYHENQLIVVASFSCLWWVVTPICIIVVALAIIIPVIILKVNCCRKKCFPHRDRTRYIRKTRSTPSANPTY